MTIVLFFFEPYSRTFCSHRILEILKAMGAKAKVLKNWGLRALFEIDDLSYVYEVANREDCISRTFIVYSIVSHRDLTTIIQEIESMLKSVNCGSRIRIEVRRWDKKYPIASIELAHTIARHLNERNLGIELNPREFECVIVIGIEREFTIIAYATKDLIKYKSAIPLNIIKRVAAIVERPQTSYEIMDLIQLSRALNLEIRLFKPNNDAFRKALHNLSLNIDDILTVQIYEDLDSLFKGIDLAIALSPYAKRNEKELISIIRRNTDKKIAFVLGNEYEDVSKILRNRCLYTIRLGPHSEMPMRTATALAYVLGITLPILAGYLNNSEK